MSAFLPKADMRAALADVRYGPEADMLVIPIFPLFNHTIGAGDERGRHRDAERLGGLHINDQLECVRLVDWQITNFSPLENFDDVSRSQTEQFGKVRAVGDQASELNKLPCLIYRRNAMCPDTFDNQLALGRGKEWASTHHQSLHFVGSCLS